ncbi:MAG TPA: enoyl-CoA hydratase [Paenalcaligenes sp.]|nr:enoyl-CoA hydratase [Paenalcaligenes sp.]
MEIIKNHAHFHLDESTGTLSICNATRLNLLDSEVILDLTQILEEIKQIDSMNSLVLRGEGDDSFIAGAHVKEMSALDPDSARVFITKLKELCDAIYLFPVPVIARIPGWCLGGGLEVALACDLRVIAEEAKIGMPEVKVGIPSVLYASMLPRMIGHNHTNWMLLSGEMVDAKTATNWGLMNFCEPLADIDQKIENITTIFSELGPKVIRQQKMLNRYWQEIPLTQAIEESVESFSHAFTTGEPAYYMNKFLNKEK